MTRADKGSIIQSMETRERSNMATKFRVEVTSYERFFKTESYETYGFTNETAALELAREEVKWESTIMVRVYNPKGRIIFAEDGDFA